MPLSALAVLFALAARPCPAALSPVLLSPAHPSSATLADAPLSTREFGSFLLGQYAKNIEAKLGKPARTGTDTDGETLWFYDLAPGRKDDARVGPGTVLAFSISKNEENPYVTMIEVSGAPLKSAPTLLGISLGMSQTEMLKILGPADKTEKRDAPAGETFDWSTRNYYLETDATGKVDRIQVVANNAGYPEAGESKPDLEGFRKALESRDRAAILDWLAADIDVYTKTDDTVNFVGSPREDIENEEALISRYIYGGTGSVRDVLSSAMVGKAELTKNPDEEEWASVFDDEDPIQAITWTFEAGRWRVYEVWMKGSETRIGSR